MMSISPQFSHPHNIPELLAPELVGIVNDYLEEPLPNGNIHIPNTPPYNPDLGCRRILETFYHTKLRYYTILELYRVMCGQVPNKAPRSFIEAEAAMRDMRLQAEQRADWSMIRSFQNYFFKIPDPAPPHLFFGHTYNPQWCVCNHVSSYAEQIGPILIQAARFANLQADSTEGYCQLSLCCNVRALPSVQYQALQNSFNNLENSIHLADMQHSMPPLLQSQNLKQRIVRCVKHMLSSSVAIGCMVLNTAFKVAAVTIYFFIFIAWTVTMMAVFFLEIVASVSCINKIPVTRALCSSIGVLFPLCRYGSLIPLAAGVVSIPIGIYVSLPYIKKVWTARKSIFQLHMNLLPACHRLWKDYTKTLGAFKGSYRLLNDFFINRLHYPSVVRSS